MTLRNIVFGVAGLAVLAVGWGLWPVSTPPAVRQADQPSASVQVKGGPRTDRTRASAEQSAGPLRSPRRPGGFVGEAPPRSVQAAEVLATVNEKPVKLRDLMPVEPGETEMEMTREEYAYRLQRAIEAELIVQAARAQDVELTPAQQKRVAQVAQNHQADLEHYRKFGATWSSVTADQMDLEERLAAAQMLELNLVARQAGVAPHPDPEKQARYEQARRELLDQLSAAAKITKTVPEL